LRKESFAFRLIALQLIFLAFFTKSVKKAKKMLLLKQAKDSIK